VSPAQPICPAWRNSHRRRTSSTRRSAAETSQKSSHWGRRPRSTSSKPRTSLATTGWSVSRSCGRTASTLSSTRC
jgi:hypothetical protein